MTRRVYQSKHEMLKHQGFTRLKRNFDEACDKANIAPSDQINAVDALMVHNLLVPVLENWFEERSSKSVA